MHAAILVLFATATAATAQGFPEPLICTMSELTCVTLCPAVGLVIPEGTAPVRIEGLPGGDLSMNVVAFDEQTPPTVRLQGQDAQGKDAQGLVGLHEDGSATLALTTDAGTIAYEGPCALQP